MGDCDGEDSDPGYSRGTPEPVSQPGPSRQKTGSTRKRALEQRVQVGEPSKKPKNGQNWAIVEHIWPAHERPKALRNPEWIEAQSIGDLMQLHKVYSKKEQKEQGHAINRATKDP